VSRCRDNFHPAVAKTILKRKRAVTPLGETALNFMVETFAKRPLLSPATGGTLGSNFNPQNTQCMDACPDFIGVVKIFACLELEQN